MTFLSQWAGNVLLISNQSITPEEEIQSRLWWIRFRQRLVYVCGVIIATCLIAFVIRRVWRQRKPVALSVFMVAALISGCQDKAPNSSADVESAMDVPPVTEPPVSPTQEPVILRVEPRLVDLGNRLISERSAKAQFTITNDSDSSIDLVKIQTSCGCTIASTAKTKLASGGSTQMIAAVNLTELGQQSSRVQILGSARNAVAEVFITWNAGSVVRVEPRGVYCGTIQCGFSHTRTLSVFPPQDVELQDCIEAVSCSPEGIINSKIEKQMDRWNITVTIAPTSPDAFGRGHVKIHGKNGSPDFRIPVEWNAVESVSVSPRGVFVGIAQPSQPWTAKYIVTSVEGAIDSISIGGSATHSEDIDTKIEKVAANRCRITISGFAPSKAGPFSLEIPIKVKCDTNETMRTTTVTGMVQDE